jgi:hypothetical protein
MRLLEITFKRKLGLSVANGIRYSITLELTDCEREAFYQIEGFNHERIAIEQSG